MRTLSILLPSAYLTIALAQTCYLPNGSPLPSTGTFFPAFQPCTSGGPSTVCCATNRTGEPGGDARDGEVKDECLPNGLCQNRRIKNGVESKYFFANYCTDKNYASGKCLDICASSRGDGGNTQVTPCTGKADSQEWCCGTSKDCCTSGVKVIKLAQILGGSLSSASTSVTFSSASTMSTSIGSVSSSVLSTASSLVAPTPASDSSSTLRAKKKQKKRIGGGTIAGIVVGALIALIVLAAIVLVMKRRSKAKTARVPEMSTTMPLQHQKAEYRIEKDATEIVELATPINELPANDAKGGIGGTTWPHQKGAELDSTPVQR